MYAKGKRKQQTLEMQCRINNFWRRRGSSSSRLLNSELSYEQHVRKLTQMCFFNLRRLRAIRRSLINAVHILLTLVHVFIATRLDYCNSALFGCKTSIIRRLQSIQNSSARLILNISMFGRITWQPCVIRYTGYLGARPSRSRSVCSSATVSTGQQCTDIFTGDLQFSQRRCTSTATSLYWPRRPGRAARQHWQIRSARFFCVRAEPVEQATTWHSESVR